MPWPRQPPMLGVRRMHLGSNPSHTSQSLDKLEQGTCLKLSFLLHQMGEITCALQSFQKECNEVKGVTACYITAVVTATAVTPYASQVGYLCLFPAPCLPSQLVLCDSSPWKRSLFQIPLPISPRSRAMHCLDVPEGQAPAPSLFFLADTFQ